MSEPHSPKPQPNSPPNSSQVSIQNSIQNFISETGPGYVIDVSVNEITFTTDSSNVQIYEDLSQNVVIIDDNDSILAQIKEYITCYVLRKAFNIQTIYTNLFTLYIRHQVYKVFILTYYMLHQAYNI